MAAAEQLIIDNLGIWTSAVQAKSAAGRGKANKLELYGIKKLRELILELAVRGLLVPQDPNDEPAETRLTKARAKLLAAGKGERRSAWKKTADVSAEEQGFLLPSGWTWARVNDTGFYVNGLAFKSADWSESGKPIIRIQNLTDASKPMNCVQGEYPEEVTVRTGDLLVSWSATLDAFIWDRDEAVLNQHIFKVDPCEELLVPGFLYWLLKVSIIEMKQSEHAHGLVMTHINRGPFLAHVVAIPPIAEQARIVAKVDELMALCEQLEQQQETSITAHQTLVQTLLDALTTASEREGFTAAWARIANHFDALFTTEWSIEQLKQTILQLAVMGKLVPQHPNDEPASELLKKISVGKAQLVKDGKLKNLKALPKIEEREKIFSLPGNWAWARVSSLIDGERDISYGIIKLGHEPSAGGIPTLRCSDVKPRYLELTSVRKVEPDIEEPYKRTRLLGGEVLLNIRGTLGGVALVPEFLAGYNIAREVAMLPFHQKFNGGYAVNLIASPYFWNMIEANLQGIAYKGLNLKILRNLPIPVPPLSEQLRIVAKVDELMAICDTLKTRLNTAQTTQLQLADAMGRKAVA